MATYKVLQDIEAEDKLFGPLTLKQFIFATIAIGSAVACFFILSSPSPMFIKIPLVMPFLPVILVFGFLAAPIGRDQPNDIWLLARLRYLLKPHKRIWNQDGIQQLVTINVPKKMVRYYSNGLSQTEVKSRLQALANTVDSRGWAIKNVNTNLFAEPSYLSAAEDSDRLIDPSSLPQEVSSIDAEVLASDDILDTVNNSTAQKLDQLVQQSTKAHLDHAISNMRETPTEQQKPANYWFMNQSSKPADNTPPDLTTFQNQPVVVPGSDDLIKSSEATEEETKLAEKLAAKSSAKTYANPRLKVLQPLHDRDGNIIKQPMTAAPEQPAVVKQVQSKPNPAILELAQNDDLNVATIARQAKLADKTNQDEVIISLH